MKRTLSLAGLVLCAVLLLCGSAALMRQHVAALRDARDTTLPLAATLPALERRLQMLQKQVELSELQAQMRTGSPEEAMRMYVLPEGADNARTLAFLDVTRILLQKQGMLRLMSDIEVGDQVPVPGAPAVDGGGDTLMSRAHAFTAMLSDEGLEQLFRVIGLSGLLTVGDALTPLETEQFFTLTELEDYSGIVPLEKFLSTDLLSYARDPRPHDEALLRSLSSERFLQEFRALTASSKLSAAHDLLGGPWGKAYAAQKLLPMPFLTLEKIGMDEQKEGWQRVTVTVRAYQRMK